MSASQPRSAVDSNKRLVVRWFEDVWNQGRRETIFELLAPNGVLYDGDTVIRGPEEFATLFYDRMRAEFTDFRITPGTTLAENDLVSLRWTARCHHKATNKDTTVTGISIVRVKDGQFLEAWQNWDEAGVEGQLRGKAAASAV